MSQTKTINISLPQQLAELAQAQVDAGYYTSVSEVVRDSLRKTFLTSDIPTSPLTKNAEMQLDESLKEYYAGKSQELSSIDDLDNL